MLVTGDGLRYTIDTMSKKNFSSNDPAAVTPATAEQGKKGQDPLKRDLFWFSVTMLAVLLGFFGLFVYNKNTNILAEWSKNIDLGIFGEEDIAVDASTENIQVDVSGEESVNTENSAATDAAAEAIEIEGATEAVPAQ